MPLDFVSVFVGFCLSVILLIIEKLFDFFGKVNIFCKTVVYGTGVTTFGCFTPKGNPSAIWLGIPIKLEIQNTSNISRVIRDIKLVFYHDACKLVEFEQCQRSCLDTKIFDSQEVKDFSYSCVIPPRDLKTLTCQFDCDTKPFFMLTDCELRLEYYDEKNRFHSLHYMTISAPLGNLPEADMMKWTQLNS